MDYALIKKEDHRTMGERNRKRDTGIESSLKNS